MIIIISAVNSVVILPMLTLNEHVLQCMPETGPVKPLIPPVSPLTVRVGASCCAECISGIERYTLSPV